MPTTVFIICSLSRIRRNMHQYLYDEPDARIYPVKGQAAGTQNSRYEQSRVVAEQRARLREPPTQAQQPAPGSKPASARGRSARPDGKPTPPDPNAPTAPKPPSATGRAPTAGPPPRQPSQQPGRPPTTKPPSATARPPTAAPPPPTASVARPTTAPPPHPSAAAARPPTAATPAARPTTARPPGAGTKPTTTSGAKFMTS